MADRLTAEKRSWNMSRIKGKDTSIEVKVRKYLFSLGFRFRKNDKRLPGKPDVVLPKYHTVIFVHGCFWHSTPDVRMRRHRKPGRNSGLTSLRKMSLTTAFTARLLKLPGGR